MKFIFKEFFIWMMFYKISRELCDITISQTQFCLPLNWSKDIFSRCCNKLKFHIFEAKNARKIAEDSKKANNRVPNDTLQFELITLQRKKITFEWEVKKKFNGESKKSKNTALLFFWRYYDCKYLKWLWKCASYTKVEEKIFLSH